MSLIRWQTTEPNFWSPFQQISTLRDDLSRLFESPLPGVAGDSQTFLSGRVPAVDVHEHDNRLVLRAELPGMKKEDINIALEDGVLTLSGERKEEKGFEKAEVYRSERFLGKFQRTFTLSFAVDAAKVEATYKDGILTVQLPKSEEAKPKQIEVKVN